MDFREFPRLAQPKKGRGKTGLHSLTCCLQHFTRESDSHTESALLCMTLCDAIRSPITHNPSPIPWLTCGSDLTGSQGCSPSQDLCSYLDRNMPGATVDMGRPGQKRLPLIKGKGVRHGNSFQAQSSQKKLQWLHIKFAEANMALSNFQTHDDAPPKRSKRSMAYNSPSAIFWKTV